MWIWIRSHTFRHHNIFMWFWWRMSCFFFGMTFIEGHSLMAVFMTNYNNNSVFKFNGLLKMAVNNNNFYICSYQSKLLAILYWDSNIYNQTYICCVYFCVHYNLKFDCYQRFSKKKTTLWYAYTILIQERRPYPAQAFKNSLSFNFNSFDFFWLELINIYICFIVGWI